MYASALHLDAPSASTTGEIVVRHMTVYSCIFQTWMIHVTLASVVKMQAPVSSKA